jgi:hypothetical protein
MRREDEVGLAGRSDLLEEVPDPVHAHQVDRNLTPNLDESDERRDAQEQKKGKYQ